MRHGKVTMKQLVDLVDRHGGQEGVRNFLASCRPAVDGLEEPKYGNETLGRWEAILNLTQKFGTDGTVAKLTFQIKMTQVM